MTDEKIPDFEAMPLEQLLSISSIENGKSNPFNDALWLEKENRLTKLGIASESNLDDLQSGHDWLVNEFSELQKRFNRLLTLLEFNGVLETPKVTLKAYMEGKLE